MALINTYHYIAGRWLEGKGETLISTNPMNGNTIWEGKIATAEETAMAADAAHQALTQWASLAISKRSHYLQQFASHVNANREQLIRLIALETGKPLWEAATEVNAVISKIDISIQAYHERCGEKQSPTAEANAWVRYKPHGVVAVLGAFNFPAHLSNGHIVPALLAGNTVLYKPSELTPAVAAFIMQCWHDSGIPPGVINCLQGNADTGKDLLATDIQGVYFTGSYNTGKRIHHYFSEKPEVILALEMGGNNPLIVDSVEAIDAAIYQTLLSTLLTAGQRCTCARRVFIQDNGWGDLFLTRLMQAVQKLKVGGPDEVPEPFMGPVISHQHALSHLKSQQELVHAGGASLITMSLLRENTGLLSPGIIDMTQVANPPDREIFAPFIQVYRYRHFEEAVQLANQTRYGLVAGLLSDNYDHYQLFYQTLRAGLISWNRPTTGALSSLPFGGVGYSGNHRPSAYFAADYCAYPVACLEQPALTIPAQLLPGIQWE